MRKCAACAARDITITILADQVDYLRGQIGLTAQSAQQAIRPHASGTPRLEVVGDDEDVDPDEVVARLNAGVADEEVAEKLLAQLQTFNTRVERAE